MALSTAQLPILKAAIAAETDAGLTLGDLAPGATKAVWIKRIVGAAAAAANDSFTLRVKGDTLP